MTPQVPGLNRAQRRQLARQGGWKGSKAKKGADFIEGVKEGERQRQAAEQAAYVEKIQSAARATRDMGLFIPGQ